jgi:hypothetical protein
MRKWWVAIGMLAATPAVAADQFDLVCTAKKDVTRYRVDLNRGEWFLEKCRGVVKIAEVTAGTLTLLDEKAAKSGDVEHHIIINRSTGDWYSSFSVGDLAPSVERGTCEPASFSGFPSPKF